jgi:hypothetical protein
LDNQRTSCLISSNKDHRISFLFADEKQLDLSGALFAQVEIDWHTVDIFAIVLVAEFSLSPDGQQSVDIGDGSTFITLFDNRHGKPLYKKHRLFGGSIVSIVVEKPQLNVVAGVRPGWILYKGHRKGPVTCR